MLRYAWTAKRLGKGGYVARRRVGLAQRRRAAGFSQERLAELLGVDRSTVVRWESGDTAPQPWLRPKLASALGLSVDGLQTLLAGAFGKPRSHDRDDLPRRELLRMFSLAGTVVAGADMTEHLDWSAGMRDRDSPSDAGSFDEATASNEHLWRAFAMTSTKRAVLPLVREQLEALIATLQRTRRTGARRRLCELVSDLFQLAGEVFFDGEQYMFAAHCYTLAAQAAREAEATDLWACAQTRHAFIGVYERQFAETLPLLESAAGLAAHGDSSLSTRYWVSAVQAEAWAGLGEMAACHRALDHSDQVTGLSGTVHNGGWLRFDGSRLPEQRGTCHVLLGQPDRAEPALQEALQLASSPRRRGCILVDLASVGLQRRDTEQVLTYGTYALRTAEQTGSGVIRRKLHGLFGQLEPVRGDHALRGLRDDIDEHLNAHRATSAT